MKAKTIKSVLRRKFTAFCDSITDDSTRALVRENTIITGGSIASMLLREKVNDYDLYFRNGETAFAVAQYFVELFKKNPPPKLRDDEIFVADKHKRHLTKWTSGRIRIVVQSAGVAGAESSKAEYEYFEGGDDSGEGAEEFLNTSADVAEDSVTKPEYRPVFLSSNAITLSDKVQLIVRFFGEPDGIHQNFDFVHCMNYWTSWNGQLVLKPDALECLLSRELRYVGSRYPLCSVIRTRKFVHRGWTINAGQYLKMLLQVGDLNLQDIDVLEDQLVGVDAAYFEEVIRLMRKQMEKTNAKELDRTYLAQVIDRIF
jgi:hypothetical protein